MDPSPLSEPTLDNCRPAAIDFFAMPDLCIIIQFSTHFLPLTHPTRGSGPYHKDPCPSVTCSKLAGGSISSETSEHMENLRAMAREFACRKKQFPGFSTPRSWQSSTAFRGARDASSLCSQSRCTRTTRRNVRDVTYTRHDRHARWLVRLISEEAKLNLDPSKSLFQCQANKKRATSVFTFARKRGARGRSKRGRGPAIH